MKALATASILTSLCLGAPASAAPHPDVVLVHGAFTGPSSWDKVAALLRAKGFRVVEAKIPMTSLAADVAVTRRAIAASKGPVVLVGHSWGGVVIGDAGAAPNVKALVYVAAFAPEVGESVQSLSGNGPPSEGQKAIRPDAKGLLSVDPAAFPKVFAGDLPPSQGAALARQQMPVAAQAFGTPADGAAWHGKPTYYAITAEDQMLPPTAQNFFAQRMKATTVTLKSSHAAPVSHPDAVAALIERAAAQP